LYRRHSNPSANGPGAHVKTARAETLSRVYGSLEKQGIHIRRSRMDDGSYSKDTVETVASHSEKFYIRANKCESLYENICKIDNRETVEINYRLYEVASIEFRQFLEESHYRPVIMRKKNRDKQLDLFSGQKLFTVLF
jgi:hypothetical protein